MEPLKKFDKILFEFVWRKCHVVGKFSGKIVIKLEKCKIFVEPLKKFDRILFNFV